jgi:hypothetical protein
MTVAIQIPSGKLFFWDSRQLVASSMVTILSHCSSSMPFAKRTLVQAILNTSTLTRVIRRVVSTSDVDDGAGKMVCLIRRGMVAYNA